MNTVSNRTFEEVCDEIDVARASLQEYLENDSPALRRQIRRTFLNTKHQDVWLNVFVDHAETFSWLY